MMSDDALTPPSARGGEKRSTGDNPSEEGRAAWLRRERWIVVLFLLFTLFTLAHFVHERWYQLNPPPPPTAVNPSTGAVTEIDYAPNVYRVFVPFIAHMLARVVPFDSTWVLTLMDVVFGFAGLFALYIVLVDRVPTARAERSYRLALVFAFLAAISLPINWVVPWQRPETMPSTCFLALATCCLLRLRGSVGWLPVLFMLALIQALTRADVAAAFGAGLLALALFHGKARELGGRARLLAASGLVLAAALGTQLYMQRVAFPHAVYPPGTPVYMLPYNIEGHNLTVFVLCVTPVAFTIVAGFGLGQRWRATDLLAIYAAGAFLPLWLMVGSFAEARIFVPFLLLLSVPVARIAAGFLCGGETGSLPPPGQDKPAREESPVTV